MKARGRLLSCIALCLLLGCSLTAQEKAQDNRFVNKGLFRAQGGFGVGSMLAATSGTNIYLHGDIEYYVNGKVSIRGESYYYLDAFDGAKPFAMNHSTFSGAFYHFTTKGQLDPYLGLQPGIAYSQLNAPEITDEALPFTYSASLNPLIAVSGGFNYFARKYFHLFIHAKYVHGKHLSDTAPVSLDELRITFGLGWNLWLVKH